MLKNNEAKHIKIGHLLQMTWEWRHETSMLPCWQISATFMTSSTSSKLLMWTRPSTRVSKASSSLRPV